MTIRDGLLHFGAHLVLERPVRRATLAELRDRLLSSGDRVAARLATVPGTPANQEMLSHVIGLERWGQRRLRVALGEPFVQEEYDGYRPPGDEGWEKLIADFKATRQDTLDLVDEIEKAAPPHTLTIAHNQFGSLSVRGWLRYLDMHANGEVQKIHR